jgi:hypothetical protein
MKKLWLLLLMVTPLQLIHAQEVKHAPTVAQCRADQKLWFSKLGQKPNATTPDEIDEHRQPAAHHQEPSLLSPPQNLLKCGTPRVSRRLPATGHPSHR